MKKKGGESKTAHLPVGGGDEVLLQSSPPFPLKAYLSAYVFFTIMWRDNSFEESTSVNREKFQGEYDSRVAVISNNKYRGLTGIGTEGFHQDGNVVDIPHAINFLYCESSISGGDTLLVPNHEVRAVLERRYPSLELDQVNFVSRQTLISQPLMFNHPVTGRPTMFYALGTLSGRYTRNGRDLSKEQTDTIIAAIDAAIEEIGFYSHTWSKGDLLMMDNIAMAHRASSGSQSKPSETVGSRVLRRVTLRGTRKLQRRSFIDATLLTGPLFPRRCSEDKCLVSLARWVDYKDGDGLFLGLSESRELCKYALDESADLAILPTKELAGMATEIVAETAVPHWILGTEYSNNSFISWPSPSDLVDQWDETGSTTSSTAASRERYPWHEESGQPNDCDGPDSEPCIFVGPNGKWFDFACERKTAPGTTPGPEITWTTGVRKMYNLHPLCMVDSAVVIDALQKQSSQVHEEL